jgi:hypothetical protein
MKTLPTILFAGLASPLLAAAPTPAPDSLPAANNIETVTVTASPVTREADRFVVSVGNFTSLAGLDGTELLKRAPGVWVADDRISINGATGAKVFVDGRELRGSTEEIVAYLRSLTSGDVARIEVVPQGGVQFSADSRGGVILITLRRRSTAGLDGHLQGSTSQGSRLSGYAPGGRLGLHTGRWTLNASGAGTLTARSVGRSTERRSNGVSGNTNSRGEGRSGRGHLTAIFDPDPRHTLGVDVEYHGTGSENRSDAETLIREMSSTANSDHHITGSTLTAGVNFIRRLDTLGSQLKVMADYTRYTTGGDNPTATTTTAPSAVRDSMWRSTTGSRYAIFTAEAGLTRKLPRGTTLQAGLRYTDDRTRDNSLYEAPAGGEWQTLPTYSYRQCYREQTGAAYASAGWSLGRWDFSAGLRGEYTAVDGDGVGRSYLSLFPAASVTHAFNRVRSWMLAGQWSRNIERPSFSAMNPARIQTSEWFWYSGNSSLRPTFIDRLSLTVIWKYRYTLTIGGNLHRDLIREFAGVDPSRPDIMYIRPENHNAEHHWFAAVTAPVRLTRWWNLTVNSVGVLQRIRIESGGPWADHWLMFNNATSAFTLPRGFYLEAVYEGQSRLYSGNSQVAPRHVVSLAAKKNFFEGRLVCGVTAANITGAGVGYLSRAGGVTLETRGYTGLSSRLVKITATWNFHSGSDFKTRTLERPSESELKRLSHAEK